MITLSFLRTVCGTSRAQCPRDTPTLQGARDPSFVSKYRCWEPERALSPPVLSFWRIACLSFREIATSFCGDAETRRTVSFSVSLLFLFLRPWGGVVISVSTVAIPSETEPGGVRRPDLSELPL